MSCSSCGGVVTRYKTCAACGVTARLLSLYLLTDEVETVAIGDSIPWNGFSIPLDTTSFSLSDDTTEITIKKTGTYQLSFAYNTTSDSRVAAVLDDVALPGTIFRPPTSDETLLFAFSVLFRAVTGQVLSIKNLDDSAAALQLVTVDEDAIVAYLTLEKVK